MSLRSDQIPADWYLSPTCLGQPYAAALVRGINDWRRYERDMQRGTELYGISLDMNMDSYEPLYMTEGNPDLDSHHTGFGTAEGERIFLAEDIIANAHIERTPVTSTHSTWSTT